MMTDWTRGAARKMESSYSEKTCRKRVCQRSRQQERRERKMSEGKRVCFVKAVDVNNEIPLHTYQSG